MIYVCGRRTRGLRILGVSTMTAAIALAAPSAAVLSASSAMAVGAQPAAASSAIARIFGSSRLGTAIATSKDEFPTGGSAQAVVLARSDTFPDALAGGPLAAKVGGPLLLTTPSGLDPAVQAEIQRVAPKGSTVYVLGGTAAISTQVDTTLTSIGYLPKRVFGNDRFATAVAIADQMGDPTTVFEATGLNFPDALAGGPAAIKSGGVILLTNGDRQATATSAYLAAHPGGQHYALGGPATRADTSAQAFAGNDRYETSQTVAAHFFSGVTTIGAATGQNFPDALAAGPDLASKGAPLLLVPNSGTLPGPTASFVLYASRTLTKALVYGGTASVGDDVVGELDTLVTATARAAAADSSTDYTGAFGVLRQQVTALGLTGESTVVVDANTGDATKYNKGAATQTVSEAMVPRAQLAALPLAPDALPDAVNSMFASYDDALGISDLDPFELFLVNGEQILLDPVAPPSVRYATYAAMAYYGLDEVACGVKDSTGRVGIDIFLRTGPSAANPARISLIFDPVTLLPLEDTVTDTSGAIVTRTTVLSITTATSAPSNPYGT